MLDVSLRSVRGRFLSITGLFFVVSALVLAAFQFQQSRATLLAELEKRGLSQTDNLVFRTSRAITTGDQKRLQEEAEAICADADVRYVIVQDRDGQTLAEATRGGTDLSHIRPHLASGAWLPDEPTLLKFEETPGRLLYHFSAPVWRDAGHDGIGRERGATVRIGYTTAPTLARIRNALWLSLGIWLILSTIGLAAIFLVTRWALRPLNGMAAVARAVASGDLSQRVASSTKDEIGALGAAFNDMTESLAASQDALARRHEELLLAIRERERSLTELRETQERLAHSESTRRAEKLRVVGQMASGVAHDFNNMLSVITGRVQLLRMKGSRGTVAPGDLQASLEIIERAALDGAETVRRIQEYSRDRNEKNMQRGDLNHMAREAAEITRPRWKDQAEENGQRVEVRLKLTRIPQIACVPSEIREILTNLIFNAVDALPLGGTITLATEVAEGGACLSITDNGTGMSPEVRDRIFEPFFTTKGVRGNGLGLSIVYGIIQRHGGQISVHDGPNGVGTTFRLLLPAATDETVEAMPELTMTNTPWRILVGDDEVNVRRTLVELLIDLGHEVIEASDGRDLLARFEENGADLIFTDLGMPDMSGWDVAAAVRRTDRRVPIILITGWGNQISSEVAELKGITRVMAKPFTVQKVSSVIAEVQGSRQAA